jgi:uridine kinase
MHQADTQGSRPMTRQDLLDDLAARITAVQPPHPVRVAVDGVDAAGKTTLADELAMTIERCGRPVIRASIDGFHHPAAIRRRRGSTSPEGYFHDSFDHDAILTTLLTPLGPNGSRLFRRRVFDVRTDTNVAESRGTCSERRGPAVRWSLLAAAGAQAPF